MIYTDLSIGQKCKRDKAKPFDNQMNISICVDYQPDSGILTVEISALYTLLELAVIIKVVPTSKGIVYEYPEVMPITS